MHRLQRAQLLHHGLHHPALEGLFAPEQVGADLDYKGAQLGGVELHTEKYLWGSVRWKR